MSKEIDYYACRVPAGGARKGCGGGAKVVELEKISKVVLQRIKAHHTKEERETIIRKAAKEAGIPMTAQDAEAAAKMLKVKSPEPAKSAAPKKGGALSGDEVRQAALAIVKRHKTNPIRIADLNRQIQEAHPKTADGTIRGATWDLAKRFPKDIKKTADGLLAR